MEKAANHAGDHGLVHRSRSGRKKRDADARLVERNAIEMMKKSGESKEQQYPDQGTAIANQREIAFE